MALIIPLSLSVHAQSYVPEKLTNLPLKPKPEVWESPPTTYTAYVWIHEWDPEPNMTVSKGSK
jgi:hypothetical protein